METKNVLTIVVPCYYEEEVLPETIKQLTAVLDELIQNNLIAAQSKLLFVDDGSQDQTWTVIQKAKETNSFVTGLKFSRNFGHQNAVMAGLSVAVKYSDMMVSIDADLQDDVQAIKQMVEAYHNGYDVVYGVRNNRDTDTTFKRKTALWFYIFMQRIGVQLVPNSADYRLMSKRAVQTLLEFEEQNLFLRGLVPLIGYKSTEVYYARKERFAGESKYPLKKMIKFAWDGITSLSITSIKFIMNLGIFLVLIGIVIFGYTLYAKWTGNVVEGWSSLMVSIWILGGVQLICISMIGQYIGKIYQEVKKRPRFIIEQDDYSQTFE